MEFPNDVVSLRRVADIIEGFWSLAPEYRKLVQSRIHTEASRITIGLIKKQYLEDREKIQAIKKVRELYHNPLTNETMGLKEAKDLVESWY